ncbi:MAG: single-stranded-DNA-specific exonuclease RecJ [Anaerolineales bacterium]
MADRHWLEPESVSVPEALSAYVGGHPLVAETLVRRGITSVPEARAFLDPAAYTPAPATELPGLAHAADRIEAAIRKGERICVWGDFDVDGQTATTVLVATLRELGADVFHHIPVRATESHGVNVPWLRRVIDEGRAELIVSCDTGVRAHEAVDFANGRGVDVVVTDHHELPPQLPEAYAIVNPHRLPEGHPLEALPGVGVAYKLAEELYRRAGRPRAVRQHLDLVALGIVADVATQRDDTRYLLQLGMEALRATERPGLRELMKNAGVHAAQLTTESIGFGLGPRLNALGRLDDANLIVDFFTTRDLSKARIIASRLERLNRERQQLCDEVERAAQGLLEKEPRLLEHAALVLTNAHWHPGVIGIVASRLAERYDRPTVLLSAPLDGPARGSARSVEGCHINEAIATQAHLLLGFGGHAAAAGMALPAERIPEFRRGLSRAVHAQRGEAPPPPTLPIDGYLELSDLTLELVDDLERLAPFGEGNPPLTLAVRDVTIRTFGKLGRSGDHLQLVVENGAGQTQRVLWWRGADQPRPEGPFDLAFQVRANTYQGLRTAQVTWLDARVRTPVVVEAPPPTLEVDDYRLEPHPETLLIPYRNLPGVALWVEGQMGVEGMTRNELEPATTLVVWTAPPGPAVMEQVLDRVEPESVVLFAVDPDLDAFAPFLEQVMGGVKLALRAREGWVDLARLAAKLAHRQVTVRAGIEWLAAKGHVSITLDSLDAVRLEPGGNAADPETSQRAAEKLQALLEETRAYRRYFIRQGEEAWARWARR